MNNCSDCPYGPYSALSDMCDSCTCDADTGFGGFTDHRIDVHFNSEAEQERYYELHGATKPDEEDDYYQFTRSFDSEDAMASALDFDVNYSKPSADAIHFTGIPDGVQELLMKMLTGMKTIESQIGEDDPEYYKKALDRLLEKAEKNGINVVAGKNPNTGCGMLQFSDYHGKVAYVRLKR